MYKRHEFELQIEDKNVYFIIVVNRYSFTGNVTIITLQVMQKASGAITKISNTLNLDSSAF
jgi:adenine deaminase